MKHYCTKCRMTFHIAEPTAGATITSCPEDDCGVRFWHGSIFTPKEEGKIRNLITVGIDPEDAKRLQTTGEIAA